MQQIELNVTVVADDYTQSVLQKAIKDAYVSGCAVRRAIKDHLLREAMTNESGTPDSYQFAVEVNFPKNYIDELRCRPVWIPTATIHPGEKEWLKDKITALTNLIADGITGEYGTFEGWREVARTTLDNYGVLNKLLKERE